MLKIFTLVTLILSAVITVAPVVAQTNNPPEWEWARRLGGINAGSRAVAVDVAGNVVVTGIYNELAVFDDIIFPYNHGKTRGYAAKYNATGKVTWAIDLPGPGLGVKMDAGGNSYIVGSIPREEDHLSTNFYLCKLDPAGKMRWIKIVDKAYGRDLTLDGAGNILVTGWFWGKFSVNGIELEKGSAEMFVAKFNTNGEAIWARTVNSQSRVNSYAITVEASDNYYVSGVYNEVIHIGAITLVPPFDHNGRDLFLAKFASDGEVLWAKRMGGPQSHTYKLALDAQDNLYQLGYFVGWASFDDFMLGNNSAQSTLFLAKYDRYGNILWVKDEIGWKGNDLAIDFEGNVLLTGNFSAGEHGMPKKRHNVAKFTSDGELVWLKKAGDGVSSSANGQGVAIDVLGNLFSTGDHANATSFGDTVLPSHQDSANGYIAKLASDAGPAILTSNLPEPSYCAGAIVPVSFLKSGTYATGNTFTAQLSDASGSFANPVTIGTGTTAPITVVLPTGIAPGSGYKLRVVATAPVVVGRESTIPVSIIARPTAPIAIPTASCGSGNVTLTVSGARAGEEYNWYATATGGEVLATDPTFKTPDINSTTHYYVSLVNSTDCESERTLVTATIDPALNVQAGSDDEICIDGGNLQLTGFSPAGGTWTGAGVNAAGIFSPSLAGAGSHTLTYTYDNGHCAGSSTKVVQVIPIPTVVASFEPVDCGTAESPSGLAPLHVKFTNTTTGATAFLWEFGDGATSQEAKPSYTYSKIGSFEVYLTTYYGNNCSSRQQVTTVQVERRNENANVFTPNGDDLNDYFVLNVSCLPINLKVFDRWGKLVFERANYQNDWDGKNQSAGIFFYQARASNGQTWTGWVEMIK